MTRRSLLQFYGKLAFDAAPTEKQRNPSGCLCRLCATSRKEAALGNMSCATTETRFRVRFPAPGIFCVSVSFADASANRAECQEGLFRRSAPLPQIPCSSSRVTSRLLIPQQSSAIQSRVLAATFKLGLGAWLTSMRSPPAFHHVANRLARVDIHQSRPPVRRPFPRLLMQSIINRVAWGRSTKSPITSRSSSSMACSSAENVLLVLPANERLGARSKSSRLGRQS